MSKPGGPSSGSAGRRERDCKPFLLDIVRALLYEFDIVENCITGRLTPWGSLRLFYLGDMAIKVDGEGAAGPTAAEADDPIGDQIHALLASLRATLESSEPVSEADAKALRTHHMAISMVVDVETLIAKRQAEARERNGRALDLGAARSEILRRIARFKAAASRSEIP